MMISRLLLISASLCLMLCAVSCKGGKFYSVGVMNRSMGDVHDVVIKWGKDVLQFGNILESRNATKSPFFAKPPASITLSWKSGDQASEMDIDMVGLIAEGFNGTIYLVIKSNGSVGVGAVNDGDQAAYSELSSGK